VVFLWRKTAQGSLVPLLATLPLNGPMRSAFGDGSRAAATAAWKAANPARGFLPGMPLGCFGVWDRDQIVSPGLRLTLKGRGRVRRHPAAPHLPSQRRPQRRCSGRTMIQAAVQQ
jgi:hypothetical protein